jgi:hypothetical protein
MAQAITIGVDASEAIADGQLGTPVYVPGVRFPH